MKKRWQRPRGSASSMSVSGVVWCPATKTSFGSSIKQDASALNAFSRRQVWNEFQNALQQDLRKAMPILAELGAVLQVHAELPGYLLEARGDARVYDHYLCSRPSIAETAAIDVLIRLSRETGCRVHVVHLATSAALDALRRARKKGLSDYGRNVPALPDVRSGTNSERRYGIQVRASDSRCDDERGALGGLGGRSHRFGSKRPFSMPAGVEVAGRRRLLCCLGRHFVVATGSRGGLGPRHISAASR